MKFGFNSVIFEEMRNLNKGGAHQTLTGLIDDAKE